MNPPKIAAGFMTINIPIDEWGVIKTLGYMELAKDTVKEYFTMKAMQKAQAGILKPTLGVVKPNGAN